MKSFVVWPVSRLALGVVCGLLLQSGAPVTVALAAPAGNPLQGSYQSTTPGSTTGGGGYQSPLSGSAPATPSTGYQTPASNWQGSPNPANNNATTTSTTTTVNQPVGQGVNVAPPASPFQPSPYPASQQPEAGDNIPLNQAVVASQDTLPVYGSQLFLGNFSGLKGPTYNGDYLITVGDQVAVKLWGAYAYEALLTVDPQGSIFLPEVGPIRVLGVKASELNAVLTQHIQRVFRNSVHLYASLQTALPVQVFVTGYVNRPGLYDGFSSSSILSFLDRAGGVNLDNGSFLDIRLMRGGRVVRIFSLYDFLVNGQMAPHQLHSGDVLYVGQVRNHVAVQGDVQNPARFEFATQTITGREIMTLSAPLPSASHVRVFQSNQPEKMATYYTLEDFQAAELQPGDRVAFFTDKAPQSVVVRVEGEHFGNDSVVLPYNATLADLKAQLKPSPKSDLASLQIYRLSVAQRQKELLQELLANFQRRLFSKTSPSETMAAVRQQDFNILDRFINQAKQAQPKGLITLSKNVPDNQVVLMDGDIVRIPPDENLVKIQGEVNQATALAYQPGLTVKQYIEQSAGLTGNADKKRIYVVHNNGELELVNLKYKPVDNDEIIIPTKISGYGFIMFKDLVQTAYQLAIAARVFVIN